MKESLYSSKKSSFHHLKFDQFDIGHSQPTPLRIVKKMTVVKNPTAYPFTKPRFFSNLWLTNGMKYLFSALIVFICLMGFGCLEQALEYPKEFSNPETEVQNQVINLTGVVDSINSTDSQIEIETTDGLLEEILVEPTTAISVNNESGKTFSDITSGGLVEISGSRDSASLKIKAQAINSIDLIKIKITSPDSGAVIISPLIVDGFAKISNQKIYWRIKDSNNAVQLSGSNTLSGDGTGYVPFRLELYLPALENKNFTLEVFSKQPSEVGLVSLPLNLLSTNKSELKVYFYNRQLDTSRTCGTVFPITRTVAETSATGRAALLELLNGPTENDFVKGYNSLIPVEATINSFSISGGVASVTVSKDFNKLNNCDKQRAEEQIKQTLLEISFVKEVVINVE